MSLNDVKELDDTGLDDTGSINIFLSVSATLIVTLILGSYIYTWNETINQTKEKMLWRDQHERALDKKFDEVRIKQDKIETAIHNANHETMIILQELVNEQKKLNNSHRR